MAETGAMVQHKLSTAEVALARARDLMRLWDADLNRMSPAELRALCLIGAEAMRDGVTAGIAPVLVAPATPREIVTALDGLVRAFSAMRKDAEMGLNSEIMAEEVMAIGPSKVALESATRDLIKTCTFPPSIAEVLAAVKEHHEGMQARARLLERLPARILEIRSKIGDQA